MNPLESIEEETATLTSLGSKIGIPQMAVQDFDLIHADSDSVAVFCDQFESMEFTPNERFYFMQLIVASLDLALRRPGPSGIALESRVERLLATNIARYQYIIDYWGGAGTGSAFRVTPMMQRLRKTA